MWIKLIHSLPVPGINNLTQSKDQCLLSSLNNVTVVAVVVTVVGVDAVIIIIDVGGDVYAFPTSVIIVEAERMFSTSFHVYSPHVVSHVSSNIYIFTFSQTFKTLTFDPVSSPCFPRVLIWCHFYHYKA